MTRLCNFWQRFGAGRWLLWLAACLGMGVRTGAAAPANVLLLIADDYGTDSSALYATTNSGASLPPTPNLAALAQEGVLFSQAYANPVCSPSRACMITGRHAFRTGVGDVVLGPGTPALTVGEFTLPEAFAAAGTGHQLASFGKWHLAAGANAPGSIGGWPHFAGSLQGAVASYTNWTKVVNGVSGTVTNYATTDCVDDARAWIQARGTNAWFAWVAFNAPHTPLHKPPTNLCPHYVTLSGTALDIENNPRPYFEAMVEALDTEIGRLLAVVDRTNTHIVFLGDNGTDNRMLQPPFPDNRGKDTIYEGGVHVPLIVAGPAVTPPGRTNATPVHAVDLYATILALAEIEAAAVVPSNVILDARSLVPLLQDGGMPGQAVLVERFNASAPTARDGRAARNGQFKLIRFDAGTEALYDLLADPYEGTNLLAGALTPTAQAHFYALTLALAGYQDDLAQPVIGATVLAGSTFALTASRATNVTYTLWRAAELGELAWAPLPGAVVVTNATDVMLTDTQAPAARAFYRIVGDSSP